MSLLSRLAVQAARAYGILSAADKTKVAASYLSVAGGGGGGVDIGGGGGAGGYLESTFTLSTLNTYTITVGAGGSGSTTSTARGVNGSNSVISGTGLSTVTSIGGGGGGSNSAAVYSGNTGGSGGGSSSLSTTSPAGTAGQGNAGGAGNNNLASGGGGGAGTAGSAGSGTSASGNGGNGSASSISGSSVTYAGGGGGGGYSASASVGTGGTGGGGAGVKTGTGVAGTTNLGGGGGGGGSTGGAGGSGIVIISYASATPRFVGGTLTTSGGNQIHTFTSSGTLSPLTPVTASYLVVAGGGGGSQGNSGGGGAGGLLSGSTTLYSGATYVVTVGGGGTGASSGTGTSGSNSILSGTGLTTLTSTGGGFGGFNTGNGASGGSGGGGAPTGTGGAGTSGQGFAGGNGTSGGAGAYSGGGGGGSSAVGSAGSSTAGVATGGAGTASSITGTSVTYAGGGGGGQSGTPASAGGSGGGGAGGTSNTVPGTSGTPNTGGGGGGGGSTSGVGTSGGGSGGSGTVIISYAGSQQFNGGLVTSSGGNTIHTFTATGALTPLTNNLTNSLRFRESASAYLNRTPTVAGNRRTWTWSAWVKRGKLGDETPLFQGYVSGSDRLWIGFDTGNTLQMYGSSGTIIVATSAVFRDPSAWYHVVVAFDTTQATAANRVKLYVNGNQQAIGTGTYPSLNAEWNINNTVSHQIGSSNNTVSYFDGYMTDINFIDGQALEPYFFGNNDANGVWKPIQYRGTYGTNGFYLNFSNTTSTTTLGNDSSGNGNNWTTNNISLTAGVTYDAMTDVPTNTSATTANYCVLNPLDRNATGVTISSANLKNTTSSLNVGVRGTMAVSSGKWYWETTITTSTNTPQVGIATRSWGLDYVGSSNGVGYLANATKYINGVGTSYGATFTTGDIIGVALDLDGGSITFYKNNTSQGVAATGLSGEYFPAVAGQSSDVTDTNFGQRPFAYTPPTGFVALNTFNLPTPTILQGNRFMDATLYTGNGSGQTVVNAGQFKPDFIWVKPRNTTEWHELEDSVRGIGNNLYSNTTNAEDYLATRITSINSNGFSIGSASGINGNGNTNVAWQWQAGQGSTSSNTSGSITSTVSVNATAGFSIVTYSGQNSDGTVGHGLGVAPKMYVIKQRNSTGGWVVYHSGLPTPATNIIYLHLTNAVVTGVGTWNSTNPTSTVFSVDGNDSQVNQSGSTYVAYCWAEIAGFSRFGSYTGNGSTDGPFVFTNFQPEFVMIKRTDATNNWVMLDATRDTYNVVEKNIYADTSGAEAIYASEKLDIVSNGFKLRQTGVSMNANGGTYIFMAFASNPFKISNAR